jgi:glucose-1-phosphate adenylyltransferase
MEKVTCIILAGGRGSRLYPLTKSRAKPAVTFGGRIKLIDIPIHLAKQAGIEDIYILTQHLSSSIHEHIDAHYMNCQIELLCSKNQKDVVFEGTADAVRKNLHIFEHLETDYFLILSGDHIYDFDFKKFINEGAKLDCDLMIMCKQVAKHHAKRLGTVQIDSNNRILNFIEKPQDPQVIDSLVIPDTHHVLASMGIYLFKKQTLITLLRNEVQNDFGKDLIPIQIKKGACFSFAFDGYWEDIGTIKTFFDANLDLTNTALDLKKKLLTKNFYHLPKPLIHTEKLIDSIVCEGTLIEAQEICNTILGVGSIVQKGSVLKNCILMGSDEIQNGPRIGKNCIIENTIIDQNVSIGNNVYLRNTDNKENFEDDQVMIKDGIIIVKEGAILPDGFSI